VLPKTMVKDRKTELKLGLYNGDRKISAVETSFLGPVNE
jgi:hypothetical protein